MRQKLQHRNEYILHSVLNSIAHNSAINNTIQLQREQYRTIYCFLHKKQMNHNPLKPYKYEPTSVSIFCIIWTQIMNKKTSQTIQNTCREHEGTTSNKQFQINQKTIFAYIL
jgi:hypothetical protein